VEVELDVELVDIEVLVDWDVDELVED